MDNLARQHIKGYELRERIAVGGFEVIYHAVQPIVGSEVGIKVILPSRANKCTRWKMCDEVQSD